MPSIWRTLILYFPSKKDWASNQNLTLDSTGSQSIRVRSSLSGADLWDSEASRERQSDWGVQIRYLLKKPILNLDFASPHFSTWNVSNQRCRSILLAIFSLQKETYNACGWKFGTDFLKMKILEVRFGDLPSVGLLLADLCYSCSCWTMH